MNKLAIPVMLLVLVGGSACGASDSRSTGNAAPSPTAPAAVSAGDAVSAEARVVPVRYAALSLNRGGTVADVLVGEGAQVKAGQALVRLDSAHQRADLATAQARFEQAQAGYNKLIAGARPEEIAAAEAQLRQTEAQLRQARSSVSPDDLRAAEAQIAQARTLLARLQSGARDTDLRASEAQLGQAQTQMTAQREQLSAAKTSAQRSLEQATNQLTQAQTSYSTAKWNWEYVDTHGTDPINPTTTDPKTGKPKDNTLNDAQKQQYRDAYTRAEAGLHSAESAVQQAQVAYDAARQAEITGIQAAEQQVNANTANLDRVRAGADTDQLAGAQAQLASARANYARLTGAQRKAALDIAQAAVESAQANLALLKAGAPESELIVARAQVQTAKAELDQAQLALDETELHAPFDGVVAALDVKASENINAGVPVVQMADTTKWQVESTDLTELMIVNLHEGSPATITFDAIPGLKLPGKVARIRTFGEKKQGDITYTVTIAPDQQDARLRWNMTAKITVEPGT